MENSKYTNEMVVQFKIFWQIKAKLLNFAAISIDLV